MQRENNQKFRWEWPTARLSGCSGTPYGRTATPPGRTPDGGLARHLPSPLPLFEGSVASCVSSLQKRHESGDIADGTARAARTPWRGACREVNIRAPLGARQSPRGAGEPTAARCCDRTGNNETPGAHSLQRQPISAPPTPPAVAPKGRRRPSRRRRRRRHRRPARGAAPPKRAASRSGAPAANLA